MPAEVSDRRSTPRPARDYDHSAPARVRGFFRQLGPGLITGAADDDPSGITTYSQAGAAFGYGLLWTALVSFPLMAGVQLMCARIGLVARRGLASVLRAHYPPWLLWLSCLLLLVGNTINIAADLGGMAACAQMLTGLPSLGLVPVFAGLLLVLLVVGSYAWIARIFKWLTLVLFTYVGAAVLARPHWGAVLAGTVAPHAAISQEYLLTFVAILGTTISPYLFFWQASQEVEDERALEEEIGGRERRALGRELREARVDVLTGMVVSNLVMYFIILTAGATLHQAGHTTVHTAAEAAAALQPIAGRASSLLFAIGLIGTGLLGVPVLAGSAGYAIAEAAAWRRGMDEKPRGAPKFYAVIAAAMLAGAVLTLTGLNPISLLFWSAVVNGLLAPPLIIIILVVCNNAKVMGTHRNGLGLNILGIAAAVLMTGAAVALIISWL